jgi:hypothetical protein
MSTVLNPAEGSGLQFVEQSPPNARFQRVASHIGRDDLDGTLNADAKLWLDPVALQAGEADDLGLSVHCHDEMACRMAGDCVRDDLDALVYLSRQYFA